MLLNMTEKMLKRLGYTVLTANTPDDALKITDDYPENIDLLITDVVMPKMNGQELAQKLLTLHPD